MKTINTTKKIIGVPGRPAVDDENDSLVAIYEEVRTSIIKKNCIPLMITPPINVDYLNTKRSDIPLLNDNEIETLKAMVDMCDGIILPGGYRWYEYDELIAAYAIEKDIPVLGICMGMQLLANMDTDIPVILNDTNIEHRQLNVKYVHNVDIVESTTLHNILNTKTISVNSKHRYHVKEVKNFIVSAYSEDGFIEGIELPNRKFVVGVQWHPEKMLDYDLNANKIFDYFIDKC